MKTVLVSGAAGGVGEEVVRRLLVAGHRVIVSSRSVQRLRELRSSLADRSSAQTLFDVVGDVGDLERAQVMRAHIETNCPPVDTIIASLGGWWQDQALLEVSQETWNAVLGEMLTTHFVFARTFIPMLAARGGRYIGMGGGAAYYPIPGASLVCIAAAAQVMMTRCLHAEMAGGGVDILELVADGAVRTRSSGEAFEPHWITAAEVAAITLDLVERGSTTAPGTTTHGPIVRMRKAPGSC